MPLFLDGVKPKPEKKVFEVLVFDRYNETLVSILKNGSGFGSFMLLGDEDKKKLDSIKNLIDDWNAIEQSRPDRKDISTGGTTL